MGNAGVGGGYYDLDFIMDKLDENGIKAIFFQGVYEGLEYYKPQYLVIMDCIEELEEEILVTECIKDDGKWENAWNKIFMGTI